MKYIIVLLSIFLLSQPAQAAKLAPVKGQMPNLAPLQPAPAGIAPNVNNNVQFSDPTHAGQFDTSTEPGQSGQTGTATQDNVAAAGNNSTASSGFPNPWILVLIILVGGAALVWVWRRSQRP